LVNDLFRLFAGEQTCDSREFLAALRQSTNASHNKGADSNNFASLLGCLDDGIW